MATFEYVLREAQKHSKNMNENNAKTSNTFLCTFNF